MKTMLIALLVLQSFSFQAAAQVEAVNLKPQLFRKFRWETARAANMLRYLSGQRSRWIAKFLASEPVDAYTEAFQKEMAYYIRDPRLLNAVAYLQFKAHKGMDEEVADLVTLYYDEVVAALYEWTDDPRHPQEDREWIRVNVLRALRDGFYEKMERLGECIAKGVESTNDRPSTDAEYAALGLRTSDHMINCIRTKLPFVPANQKLGIKYQPLGRLNLAGLDPVHPGQVISRVGFTPGNRVTVLNRNRNTGDRELLKIMFEIHEKVVEPKIEKRWSGLSDDAMVEAMAKIIQTAEPQDAIAKVFDLEESRRVGSLSERDLLDINKHPAWESYGSDNKTKPHQTFPAVRQMVQNAKKSIVIDLFFFGGTMTLALTQTLVEMMEVNPDLEVYVLHDMINHFGHGNEMTPVFNFLRAYMLAKPSAKLLVVPSNIVEKKISGLPGFIEKILSDEVLEKYGLNKCCSLYLKAQSDHSKVIIVDGNDLRGQPKVFVGSKNMTDASGALTNDVSLLIEGPAAVVALDDYWPDLYQGLHTDWKRHSEDSIGARYQAFAEGRAARKDCSGIREQDSMMGKSKNILCSLDLLRRFEFGSEYQGFFDYTKAPDIFVALPNGKDGRMVRLGGNNFNASVTNAQNQNIYAILSAKHQILIQDQLLYDDLIVQALLFKARHGVKIRILLESFIIPGGTPTEAPGMPNILYFHDLTHEPNIEVRWKTHAMHADLDPRVHFLPEHHGKTISIDGLDQNLSRVGHKDQATTPVLIAGSANKDFMTMRGSFRELQAEVMSYEAVEAHDTLFWAYFSNDSESRPASAADFEASALGQRMKGLGVDSPRFMRVVRQFLELFYEIRSIQQ